MDMELEKVPGARRVDEMRRFRMLMAGVYCGIALSSTYGYSIFARHLSDAYGFDQRAITTISTVGNVCGYFTLPMGFVLDYFGPQAVFPIAGFLGFLGFLLFGLTFNGYINPSVVTLSVFNAILYFGCPALDSAVMMSLMLNFPRDTGAMVIIQKTFSGLGTSVLMVYYQGWFQGNFSAYAYFIGAQLAFCSFIGFLFIRYPPYYQSLFDKYRTSPEKLRELQETQQLYLKQKVSSRRLTIGYVLVGCCLVFLATQSIAMAYKGGATFREKAIGLSVITVILVALFAVMALPFQFLGKYVPVTATHIPGIGIATVPTIPLETMFVPVNTLEERSPTTEKAREGADAKTPASAVAEMEGVNAKTPASAAAEMEEEAEFEEAEPAEVKEVAKVHVLPQHQHGFFHNILTVDLWCIWFTCFGMWGTITVMQMNASQIYSSINLGTSVSSTLTMYVSVMSIGSAIGRIGMGIYDMVLSAKQRAGTTTMVTTTLLPLPPFLCFLAFLFFAVLPADALILPFLVGSMGNGSGWGLGLLCVRKMYAKDLGRHYTFLFSAGMLAVILLNSVMFGRLYDQEAKRQNTYPKCLTPACVRTSMWILMAINALSMCTALFVHIRFRRFTAIELARRAEEAAEEDQLINSPIDSVEKEEVANEVPMVALGLLPANNEPVVGVYAPTQYSKSD